MKANIDYECYKFIHKMKGPTTEGKEENAAEQSKNPSQQMLNTGSSSVLLPGAGATE